MTMRLSQFVDTLVDRTKSKNPSWVRSLFRENAAMLEDLSTPQLDAMIRLSGELGVFCPEPRDNVALIQFHRLKVRLGMDEAGRECLATLTAAFDRYEAAGMPEALRMIEDLPSYLPKTMTEPQLAALYDLCVREAEWSGGGTVLRRPALEVARRLAKQAYAASYT